jgi:hypothetical protein
MRTALATALLLTPAAASADFYQYETEGGVLSFTDDAARIPARYADQAERQEDRALADYERLSVAQPGASIATAMTTLKPEALVVPSPEKRVMSDDSAKLGLQIDDAIVLQVDPERDEPIYVDRRRYITRNGIMTPHTVVSRGGKPLIYISDRPH